MADNEKQKQLAEYVKANQSANKKAKKKLPKPTRPAKPIRQENFYKKKLRAVVDVIRVAVKKYLLPELPALTEQYDRYRPTKRTDDLNSDLNSIFANIKTYINKQVDPDEIPETTAIMVNSFQKEEFMKMVKSVLGVDIFMREPWLNDHLNQWIGTNADLIRNVEDKALHDIKYQVQSGFTQGLRHEEISANIQERLDVTDSRADLIARDQISKLNGQLNELRQTDLGITQYIWSTAHDERVRESHAEKDGETFDWDDPPEDTGNPGEDINCRCVALPVFDEDLFT
jgi:SPP1 gp7 family putative phage head morphogenesis protein